MKTMPIVLNTTSEEETSIDSDWVKQFLEMSDEELSEVVVLGVDDDDDDDDCVVLEGDPESQVKCVDDSSTGSGPDEEILVVGEKGQIACRDYPHSRHLCVKFPYPSTPHERHCGQCHCYVCDSPAPCLKWGDGLSNTDHCHATDKSEIWKTLRQDSLSASTNSGTSSNVVNSQPNHMLPLETARLSPNSVLVNPTSRSTALLPLSANLIPQNQAYWNACSSLSSRLQNQVSRSTETHPHSVNLIPQNQAYLPITMNACSSLGSGLQNQASRSTATHPLSVNLMPQNQVSRPITMNACSSLVSGPPNQASRSNATHPLSVNLMPQNQVSRPITMNACSSLGSGLQNQASRSTATHPLSVNLMPQNQVSQPITMNACSSLVSGLPNQASRSNAIHPLSVNLMPQNQVSRPITMNACSSLGSGLQNQASRSTATHPLSVNLMPQNQVSRPITMNACSSLVSGLPNQASRSTATHPLSVNLMPQNQVSRPITMNACSSQGSGLPNQASRSTATHPLSVNLMPQNHVSRQITMNACSSLGSGLQNQASRSTATHPHPVNLIPQNQVSQPITINAMSLQNYRLQNQISRPNNAPGCSTASNFTIPNGANNGICQESGPTLVRNRYPSNTAARIPLGVRNHAIQKKRGHGVGTGNPVTMNHVTAPGAPGFSNHINTQYSDISNAAAATGFSNSRNGHGQDGVRITKAINPLLTQPSHSPAYETQPSYQSNSIQNLYGYNNFQGDESLSSYVARLNTNRYLNEHQIGSQNENIINSGATVQDVFQQKPHGGIQNEGFLASDSSSAENTNQNISSVQNLASQNISQNENESSAPFNGNTRLSLDEIKHFLFDSS